MKTVITEGLSGEAAEEKTVASRKNSSKIKALIPVAIIAVIAVVAFILFHDSEFKKVEKEAVRIAGRASSGKNYFTIDTYPDEYKSMDETTAALLRAETEKNALEAIQYANKALGFSDSLYQDMLNTSAIMGRQSEENEKYRVKWSYHPDDGLEVTYEKK